MKQQQSSTKRHVLDPAQFEPLLREIMPVGGGELPSQVIGWTRAKIWTRLRADYPNGFRLEVYFDKRGDVSSCRIVGEGIVRPEKAASQTVPTAEAYHTIADSDGDDGA